MQRIRYNLCGYRLIFVKRNQTPKRQKQRSQHLLHLFKHELFAIREAKRKIQQKFHFQDGKDRMNRMSRMSEELDEGMRQFLHQYRLNCERKDGQIPKILRRMNECQLLSYRGKSNEKSTKKSSNMAIVIDDTLGY